MQFHWFLAGYTKTEGTGTFWLEGTVNPIPFLLCKKGTKFLLQFQKLLELLEL